MIIIIIIINIIVTFLIIITQTSTESQKRKHHPNLQDIEISRHHREHLPFCFPFIYLPIPTLLSSSLNTVPRENRDYRTIFSHV